MGWSIFQRLVLHGLALLLWHSGEREFAKLCRTLANGHHTESQQDALMREWWAGERAGQRRGLQDDG